MVQLPQSLLVSRRQLFKSASAFIAATSLPSALPQASGPPAQQRLVTLSDTNATVETASGRVRGYTDAGIHTFKGIPYGAPPVGSLRFMPPERPKPWSGV